MKGPEAGTPSSDVFNPFRIGLDHIALACDDREELDRVAAALSAAGVENTGLKFDKSLGDRPYVAFKDPDRIAWELYLEK
jgi:catechol 2,3-dioxygenase-like lactoylglutathione lyase family enzyme